MTWCGPVCNDARVSEPSFVSTGNLPGPGRVQELVNEAHARFSANTEGENSQVYPALSRASSKLFGLCLVSAGGQVCEAGDAGVEFTIMSVSKPFVFGLVCGVVGVEDARDKIGVNATGHPFNSLAGIERDPRGLSNPMVNSGAIATTSLVPGATREEKWNFIREGLSRFAGRELSLDEEVFTCASETNTRNQSIARLLQSHGAIYLDPAAAVDLYTRQCSLKVSARDLAVMAATLAGGGVNPLTREKVVEPSICHCVLAVMATAGLYENSGDWLYDVGLPGKSGISGGLLAVSPGKGGFGSFAPPLDAVGNSIKGRLAAKFLSAELGMDLFVSRPQV